MLNRYSISAITLIILVALFVHAQAQTLTGALGNLVYYLSPTQTAPVPQIIYTTPYLFSAPSDPLHAAFAACPSIGWTKNASVNSPSDEITDSNGNIEVAAISGTTGQSAPSWPPTNAPVNTLTTDGSVTWALAGPGVVSSSPCSVYVTAGDYPLPTELFLGVGNSNSTQTLRMFAGARIKVTNRGGAGRAGVVVANKGAIIGENSQNGGSIQGDRGADVDAIVESWDAWGNSALGLNTDTPNMDVENLALSTGNANVRKAVLWPGGVEGQGYFANLYISPKTEGSTGVLVNDIGRQWNALYFNNVWIGANQHQNNTGVGYDIECGAYDNVAGGSQSLQIIGGAVVNFGGPSDPSQPGATYLRVHGDHNHPCMNIFVADPYFETTGDYTANNTGGTLLDLAYVSDFEGYGLAFNGGKSPLTAVHIVGGYKVDLKGYCKNCSSTSTLIQNDATGYSTPRGVKGSFEYHYTAGNDNRTMAPIYDGVH